MACFASPCSCCGCFDGLPLSVLHGDIGESGFRADSDFLWSHFLVRAPNPVRDAVCPGGHRRRPDQVPEPGDEDVQLQCGGADLLRLLHSQRHRCRSVLFDVTASSR